MKKWPATGTRAPASSKLSKKVAWPSGLRRWFKAPVSSEAWVRFLLSVDEHMLFSALAFFGFFAASSLCSAL